jgi:CBS domain-containing membrane protein
MLDYFNKWGLFTNGTLDENAPPRKELINIFCSGLFSFIGIFIIILIEHYTDFLLVIASFAASAVLIYDSIESPLAQPRNVIGGHILCSITGVSCYKLFMLNNSVYFYTPVVGALSVSLSIMLMGLTRTTHPPGAASALIAVIGPPRITDMGYMYVLYPILPGISIMVLVAVITNNLLSTRRYPIYWV